MNHKYSPIHYDYDVPVVQNAERDSLERERMDLFTLMSGLAQEVVKHHDAGDNFRRDGALHLLHQAKTDLQTLNARLHAMEDASGEFAPEPIPLDVKALVPAK